MAKTLVAGILENTVVVGAGATLNSGQLNANSNYMLSCNADMHIKIASTSDDNVDNQDFVLPSGQMMQIRTSSNKDWLEVLQAAANSGIVYAVELT